MKVLRIALRLGLFIILFLFIACTSTKFIIWKDKTYQEHPERILVVNSFPDPATRRIFEEEFVEALNERKVDFVVKYPVIHDPIMLDKDAIMALAKEVGADTVLITRPVGSRIGTAGALNMFINTQTDGYDMKSRRLILIATAETQVAGGKPSPSQVQTLVKDLVNHLSRLGLF